VPGIHLVVRCVACGSGRTLPEVDDVELGAFYPERYGPYELPRSRAVRIISAAIRRRQARSALRGMPLGPLRSLAPGRALDVGCGRGDLGAALIRYGWRVAGVEPSGSACETARSRGIDARQGTLASVDLEPQSFDAAVFQHSLEHVTDPVRDLGLTRAALRPGGLVSITVPNFGSWQSRRFGSRWFHLDLPRHRTHFSARGLTAALERAGLEPLEVRTSTSSIGLPASAQYVVFGRCLFPEGMPLRVAAGLCVLAYPAAALLDRLAGGGDVLHAVARRPR
jgi:SAM-dependent methyltransferase